MDMPLVSSAPDFELAREIEIPKQALHDFLCNLHRYVPLHPFIESIQDLPPNAARPSARRYRVVDRIPVGPVKLKTVYTAELDPVGPDEVHGRAWQRPSIRLLTVYRLESTASGTRLVESCRVAAPKLLRAFTVAQARKAHARTLDEMKSLLEGGQGMAA